MDFFGWGYTGLLMLAGLASGIGIPLGIPPGQEDPMLDRVAPEQCLFYASWAGTAKPDANSRNRTEQLLANPDVQRLPSELEQYLRAGLALAALTRNPQAIGAVGDAVMWGKTLMSRPSAVFISRVFRGPEGLELQAGLVVNLGDRAEEIRKSMERQQAAFFAQTSQRFTTGDSVWYRVRLHETLPVVTWGVQKQYFIAGLGPGTVEGIVARSQTPPPAWLASLRQRLPIPRRATVAYVNIRGMVDALVALAGDPQPRRIAEALGFGNVNAILSSTGLDETGFVVRTVTETEGRPTGLLALSGGKSLHADDLKVIPRDAIVGAAAKIEPKIAWQTFLATYQQFNVEAAKEFLANFQRWEQRSGINFNDDVLSALGDTWWLYSIPGPNELAMADLTIAVQVRDAQRLAKVQSKLIDVFNREVAPKLNSAAETAAAVSQRVGGGIATPRSSTQSNSPAQTGGRIERIAVDGHEAYHLRLAVGQFTIDPAWALTDRMLIVTLRRENLHEFLSRGNQFQSLGQVPQVAQAFQADSAPATVAYRNTEQIFRQLYPAVQAVMSLAQRTGRSVPPELQTLASKLRTIEVRLDPSITIVRQGPTGIETYSHRTLPGGNPASVGPIAMAIAIPAVQASRMLRERQVSADQMEMLANAMLNYEKTHHRLPPPYVADAQGKPLLSWRVLILPFLGQIELYEQFHLNEPWDSPHNRQLLGRMPAVFRSPSSDTTPGNTNYLVVRGRETLFPGGEPVSIAEIKDQPSETVLFVEASDRSAVPWTKPQDLQLDPKNPTQGITGLYATGFQVALADGHVRFVANGISPQTALAFLTRSGGEKINGKEPLLATPPQAKPIQR